MLIEHIQDFYLSWSSHIKSDDNCQSPLSDPVNLANDLLKQQNELFEAN
jgi:hypothetical protein